MANRVIIAVAVAVLGVGSIYALRLPEESGPPTFDYKSGSPDVCRSVLALGGPSGLKNAKDVELKKGVCTTNREWQQARAGKDRDNDALCGMATSYLEAGLSARRITDGYSECSWGCRAPGQPRPVVCLPGLKDWKG